MELDSGELCAANLEGMFATVFAFVLDLETGVLRYANGGHNPPLLLRAEGAEYLRPKPGIALGLFEGMKMGTGSAVLRPGEGILLYYGRDHGGRERGAAALRRGASARAAVGAAGMYQRRGGRHGEVRRGGGFYRLRAV